MQIVLVTAEQFSRLWAILQPQFRMEYVHDAPPAVIQMNVGETVLIVKDDPIAMKRLPADVEMSMTALVSFLGQSPVATVKQVPDAG